MGPVEAFTPPPLPFAAAATAETALLVLLALLTLEEEEEGGDGEEGKDSITFEEEVEGERGEEMDGESVAPPPPLTFVLLFCSSPLAAAAVNFRPWPCRPPPTGPLSLRRPLTEVGVGFSGFSFSGAGEVGGHFLRPLEASKPMPPLLALLRARSAEPSLSNRCTIDATDNWTRMKMIVVELVLLSCIIILHTNM